MRLYIKLIFEKIIYLQQLITNLSAISLLAQERETENDAFRSFLQMKNSDDIDNFVHLLNDEITPQIDCTQCGQCCNSLMINITEPEAESLAAHLQTSVEAIKEKYI